MLRVDFHVHSAYSHDAVDTIPEILRYARIRQLDAIAITDHETTEGSIQARKIRSQNDVQVIPGMELTVPVREGGIHLIALYLENKPMYGSIAETIREIKRRGGIVVLPHPFRTGTGLFFNWRQGLITDNELEFALDNIDYIEAINLKDTSEMITQTLQLVNRLNCPIVAGTDAHIAAEIGMVYCEIESLDHFRSGTERPVVVAHTRGESGLTIYCLSSCLMGHGNAGSLVSKLQARILSIGGRIFGFLFGSSKRTFLVKKFRSMLAIRKRRYIDRLMKSSIPVRILKVDSSLTVLAPTTRKRRNRHGY
ncbi:PHP domain-containing protein [Chloroflexota bacterium]